MIRKKDIKEAHEEAAASHFRGHINVGSPDAAMSVATWASVSDIAQPELSTTDVLN